MRTDRVLILYIVTCTALLSEGLPDNYLQKRESIHNQHSETTNLNAQNDVLSGSSSLETISPHGFTIKVGANSTLDRKSFCKMCVCRRPFDERCLPLCCSGPNSKNSDKISPLELVTSQETVSIPDPTRSSVPTATKGDHANQVHHQNYVSHTRTDSNATNGHLKDDLNDVSQDHQLNVVGYTLDRNTDTKGTIVSQADAEFRYESQPVTGRPESENPLSSKPTISDSDANSVEIPEPVSISTDDSVNILWVVLVLLLPALFIVLLIMFIRQWRLRKSRESYSTTGLYCEFRPSSLRDIMNDHSD